MDDLCNIEGVKIISENFEYGVANKYFYYPVYIGIALLVIFCIIGLIRKRFVYLYIGGMFVFASIGVSFGSSVSNMRVERKTYQFSIINGYFKNNKQAMKEAYKYFDIVNDNEDGTYEGIIICNESEK